MAVSVKLSMEVANSMARRKKMKMKALDLTAYSLLLIGGLNWGLVGIFEYNLVEALLGSWPKVVRSVYGLVGVAALYGFWTLRKLIK